MGDTSGSTTGVSRRDLLKKSVVAGGLVWAAPTVLAAPAGATHQCNCPHEAIFGLKFNVNEQCAATGGNPSTGNCAASGGFTTVRNGCCLITAGLVRFTESADDQTHTYVLADGVRFCGAWGKCANDCISTAPVVTVSGQTVTVTCPNLSHSEIVVCVDGTVIPAVCA